MDWTARGGWVPGMSAILMPPLQERMGSERHDLQKPIMDPPLPVTSHSSPMYICRQDHASCQDTQSQYEALPRQERKPFKIGPCGSEVRQGMQGERPWTTQTFCQLSKQCSSSKRGSQSYIKCQRQKGAPCESLARRVRRERASGHYTLTLRHA